MKNYPDAALERAAQDALEWLVGNQDGYPRSWEQEQAHTERRGYDMYDGLEAPPIAGYESLERKGFAKRLEILKAGDGQERVHFQLI